MASSQETEERLKAALADRYRIEREIGSGGMATVYLGRDVKPANIMLGAGHAVIEAFGKPLRIEKTPCLDTPEGLSHHEGCLPYDCVPRMRFDSLLCNRQCFWALDHSVGTDCPPRPTHLPSQRSADGRWSLCSMGESRPRPDVLEQLILTRNIFG